MQWWWGVAGCPNSLCLPSSCIFALQHQDFYNNYMRIFAASNVCIFILKMKQMQVYCLKHMIVTHLFSFHFHLWPKSVSTKNVLLVDISVFLPLYVFISEKMIDQEKLWVHNFNLYLSFDQLVSWKEPVLPIFYTMWSMDLLKMVIFSCLLSRKSSNSWLSTGWFTMAIALELCDRINVYGMVPPDFCR